MVLELDINIKRIKLDSHHFTKTNSGWIKDLCVRVRMIKLLKENIEGNFMILDYTMISYIRYQNHKKKKRGKLDFINIKNVVLTWTSSRK